jgi:hypothetical protein
MIKICRESLKAEEELSAQSSLLILRLILPVEYRKEVIGATEKQWEFGKFLVKQLVKMQVPF